MVTYLTEIVENEPSECDRPILQNAQWGRPTHYYLHVGAHAALRQMGAPDALGAPSRRVLAVLVAVVCDLASAAAKYLSEREKRALDSR